MQNKGIILGIILMSESQLSYKVISEYSITAAFYISLTFNLIIFLLYIINVYLSVSIALKCLNFVLNYSEC